MEDVRELPTGNHEHLHGYAGKPIISGTLRLGVQSKRVEIFVTFVTPTPSMELKRWSEQFQMKGAQQN